MKVDIDFELLERYKAWLDMAAESKIIILRELDTLILDYQTRHHQDYRKRVRRKMSRLRCAIEGKDITMMTLTVGQRDYTIQEAFQILKNGWRQLSANLRARWPGYDYLTVFEPHKSGYPHMHVIIVRKLTAADMSYIRDLWAEKYQIGLRNVGVKFSPRRFDGGGLVGYVLKYLSKQFIRADWTPEQYMYYAVMWKHKYRTYNISRGLSQQICVPRVVVPVNRALCIFCKNGKGLEALRLMRTIDYLYLVRHRDTLIPRLREWGVELYILPRESSRLYDVRYTIPTNCNTD